MTTAKMGAEGFRWFIGIVEDLMDPLQLGRVKVRVFDEYDEGIETKDIEWAHMLMPNTSESALGVGDTPGLGLGSNVIGFFLDSQEKQIMMILGSFPIIPDMDNDKHSISYLARGKQTLTKTQIGPEPKSSYAAQYPHNRVIQTKSGHVIELDDTPENERVHIYHKSGSYVEISKDGRMVTKSVGDNYEITQTDKTVYVKGSVNIKVEGHATIECPTTDIKGNVNIKGNVKVTGNVDATGYVTATGEVTGNNIKLSTHRHPGVMSGGSVTSTPI